MHYWNAVKNEFVNRYAKDYPFFYTTVKFIEDEENMETAPTVERKSYTFNVDQKLYLTQREADCIYFLSQGMTIKKTAVELILSPRTVEFYLQRIKEKFKQPNKKSLLEHLKTYDYFEEFMSLMQDEFGD
jgi:DNA-binding CsgD family transcriptional regulator